MPPERLDRQPPPDAAIERAIAWSVALHSGTAGPEVRQACDAWRAEADAHERAWQCIQQVERPFASAAASVGPASSVLGGAARRTLERAHAAPDPARRRALRHLAIASAAGALGYAGYTRYADSGDYSTTVAQRRTVVLADGTRLVLDASTSVDVRYDATARTIALRRGQVLVETGHRSTDGQPLPPFWVTTPQGRMQALGTRFIVSLDAHGTRVQVEDGAVGVYARGTDRSVVVHPGEAQRIDLDGTLVADLAQPDAAAWTDGAIVAQSMRLAELIEQLGRYRHGWLSCAPDVADLRVSGVFRLEDSDLALAAVARSLPVRIVRRTAYWVRVVPA